MAHYQVEWDDGEWSVKSFVVTEKEFLNDPDPAGFPWSSPAFSVPSDASVADPLTDPTFHHNFYRRRKIARNQGPCDNRTEVEFQICYHGCCYGYCCCCCCCWDSRWPLWWCCYCCNGLSAWWHCLSRWLAGCGGQLTHCCTRFRNSGSLLMMTMLLSRWLWLMSPFCSNFSLNSSWLQAKQKKLFGCVGCCYCCCCCCCCCCGTSRYRSSWLQNFFVSFCVQVAA